VVVERAGPAWWTPFAEAIVFQANALRIWSDHAPSQPKSIVIGTTKYLTACNNYWPVRSSRDEPWSSELQRLHPSRLDGMHGLGAQSAKKASWTRMLIRTLRQTKRCNHRCQPALARGKQSSSGRGPGPRRRSDPSALAELKDKLTVSPGQSSHLDFSRCQMAFEVRSPIPLNPGRVVMSRARPNA